MRLPILTKAFVLCLLLQAPHAAGAPAQEDLAPGRGVLLVSAGHIQDPRFRKAVIVLLQAGPGGALGVIINKPTATRVSSRFRGLGGRGRSGDPLYFGGPVGGHELLMLRRTDRANADWVAVVDGVFVTNRHTAMMDALMAGRTEEEVRVFAGYAGWAADQLEGEIKRGDWFLLAADAALIFRRDATKLWPELDRKSREIVL